MELTIANKPKRLVMIDDDPAICEFVREVAEPLEYAVETYTIHREFEAALNRGDPDILILDINMPVIDGFEILGMLAKKGTRARIYIMSGYDPEYQKMALLLGKAHGLTMGGLIPKPVCVAELKQFLA